MINYLLICRSLTYAQRVAKILKQYGITAIVVRIPQEIAKQGCGYSVKIREKHLAEALKILKKSDISPLQIFAMFSDGRMEEVSG